MATTRVPFYLDPDFWRPQTYMIIAAMACLVAVFGAPLLSLQLGDAKGYMVANEVIWATPSVCTAALDNSALTLPVFAVATIVFLDLIVVLLLYKRQTVQLLLVLVTAPSFLLVGGVAYLFAVQTLAQAAQTTACAPAVSPAWGSAFLVVGALFCSVASSRINQDRKRLKQMDRFW